MSWMRATGLGALGAALAIHAGLLAGLFAADAPRKSPPARPPVRIRVASRPKIPKPAPEPVPAPAPEPEPPKIAAVTPAPEPPRPPVEKPKKKPPAPPTEPVAPKPPAEPAPSPPEAASTQPASDEPPEPPRPVRKFTVALDATVASGGVAVPVSPGGSGFAFGAPDGDPDAEPRLPSRSPRFARVEGLPGESGPARPYEVSELTRAPRPLSQPSPERLRALYPEAARKANLEANVSLRLRVSARGEVVEVRIVREAGNGFDDVAERLAREIRFQPGERAGQPVEVWISWTFRFRLDG